MHLLDNSDYQSLQLLQLVNYIQLNNKIIYRMSHNPIRKKTKLTYLPLPLCLSASLLLLALT